MKHTHQKTIVMGTIVMLLFMTITSIQATNTPIKIKSIQSLNTDENTVADVALTWDSFFHNFSFKNLAPNVTINQSATKDFYFPEINGTIPMINFTVVCKHKLLNPVLLPRFTQVYLAISYNGSYILLNQSNYHRCQSLDWEYINLTVESRNGFVPLVTNGQNITLDIEVGAFFFIFGSIEKLAPITIHPIPV